MFEKFLTQKRRIIGTAFVVCVMPFVSCESGEDNPSLVVNPAEIVFGADGGTKSIDITTDAGEWSIFNPASDWLTVSSTEGEGNTARITLTISTRTLESRTGLLLVSAGGAKAVEVSVTQEAADHLFVLKSDISNLSFSDAGGTMNLNITSDGPAWSLSSDAGWLEFGTVTGINGITTVSVTADENIGNLRTASISFAAEGAATLIVPVSQSASLFPNYNVSPAEPDASGMEDNAVQLAAKIKLGWNVGNTLEAIGGETMWGNPKVTKALIDLVKQSGFNAIRVPCSWNQYVENTATAKIKTEWLDRVKEVVGYCVENDMHVILNIHWDGGWLENNITVAKQTENKARQKAFWQQIATHLRDYDQHLLFASANEPNVEDATQMTVLNSYHQTFVDAVRSTGGRNSYRVLVIQGPSTDIEKTNTLMNALPADEVPDRMMAEIHYYTPYQYCLMSQDETWGNMFYYWGSGFHSATDASRNATWGEEDAVNNLFGMMKTKFVDKGIPVVLGEYAAIRRNSLRGDALALHLASREYFLKYVTKQARANGLLPFYWDAGGSETGLFNRQDNTVADQQALDALVAGATQ
jgi:endoglucanase